MLWTSQPEIIFHLAATVTARESIDLVQPTLNNIVVASVNLMTAASEAGCKQFISCATSEQAADHASLPASPYAAAKDCVSTYARLFRSKYALAIREVMPFLTFGPGQDKAKLIPHIITSLLSGVAPKLSDGNRTFDLIYIDDVIRGILMTAVHPTASDQPIELGSGTAIAMKEIVARIARLSETNIAATFDSSDKRTSPGGRAANLSHSMDATGWLPIWHLDEALQETIAWYRQRCNDG
jgi:nucleoside-diphosphate-sugar epimerase